MKPGWVELPRLFAVDLVYVDTPGPCNECGGPCHTIDLNANGRLHVGYCVEVWWRGYWRAALEAHAAWQAWESGKARCPLCVGLDDWDWHATCDCTMAPEPTTPCPWPAPLDDGADLSRDYVL